MENLFEYYFEAENFHLKYAKGEPSVKEQEFHDYNEFVFFMNGTGTFISKNIQHELIPDSIIMIPREHFHQFCISQPQDYVRLILGFRENSENSELVNEVMDRIKIVVKPDKKISLLFLDLAEIIKSYLCDKEKKMFIEASLIQLLIYLKQSNSKVVDKSLNLSPLVMSALNIIDEKYHEHLSVDRIASLLYISPSTLAHKFKKELNISIYRYITKKRLSVAHELIKSGESLTYSAFNCGFRDYSCFYRLYKKYYDS